MNAIVLTAKNQSVQLTTVETPIAGPGEVIVNIRAAALNHRDVFVQQGLYPGIKLPVILGSDGAGVVSAVGAGVDESLVGQEVTINCSLGWGSDPRFYDPATFQILGMPTNGTFAEYVRIGAEYVHPKPTHLSFAEAAALPLAGLTAWRALMTRAALQPGERVLITGIGAGTALFALQFALAQGAEVWVTSGSAEKIQKAVALGAKGGVNYREADWQKTLLAQTGGGRLGYFDVVIDSAGGSGFAKLTDVAAPGARIAIFGGTTGNITDVVPGKVFFKQLNIFGTTMGTPDEFAAMLQLVGERELRPVVDMTFDLADAEQALRRMDDGKQFGKIVLTV
jgi:zinc-binding alcohol dehydrogenase/oxidoreductase